MLLYYTTLNVLYLRLDCVFFFLSAFPRELAVVVWIS